MVLALSSYLLFVFPVNHSNFNLQVTPKPSGQTPNQQIIPTSTFLFAGDLMLDRLVYHNFKNKGLEHIFDNFDRGIFSSKDVSAVNLEGPISATEIDDDFSTDNLSFNFPPETVSVLQYLNINAISLANNHTLNAGADGFESTKKALDAAKILYAGGENFDAAESTINFKSDIPVSVVCVDLLTNPNLNLVADKIKSEKEKGNFVIVFPHWGSEYQTSHSASQQKAAHQFIDAGADAIFGSHPHVAQDLEIYQGKPIIYSMGNFVFDQLFSKETQQGLLIGGKIAKSSLELSFFPIKSINLQPQLMQGEEKQVIIGKLLGDKSQYELIRSDTIKLTR